MKQTEIDLLGISLSENGNMIYAVDVAFHEGGLRLGNKRETVIKVVTKILRTAMCIRGFFGSAKAEIIYASPKINPATLAEINKPTIIDDINCLFKDSEWEYTARIIANDDFYEHVMKPIKNVSDNVSDTSELFLRAHQLIRMTNHS